jgi:hypothetical protein
MEIVNKFICILFILQIFRQGGFLGSLAAKMFASLCCRIATLLIFDLPAAFSLKG